MHKQLPAIILAVVIIAAIIGMVVLFKAPSYGKAGVMPMELSAARTAVQTAPRLAPTEMIQFPPVPRSVFEKAAFVCETLMQKYAHSPSESITGESITGLPVGSDLGARLFGPGGPLEDPALLRALASSGINRNSDGALNLGGGFFLKGVTGFSSGCGLEVGYGTGTLDMFVGVNVGVSISGLKYKATYAGVGIRF